MVELKDWDFPVPDSVVLVWLSLLEALVWGGIVIFTTSMFYAGGFLPLPFSPSGTIVGVGLLAFFILIAAAKFKQNDIFL